MFYKVRHVEQLRMYAAELLAGIREIHAGVRFVDMTPEQILDTLPEFVGENEGIWFVLDDRMRLTGWIAAKVYRDGPRLTAAINWAWSEAGEFGNGENLKVVEQWARSRGATAIYTSRRLTRLKAFVRLMKKYGYSFECIVVGKQLVERPARPAPVDTGNGRVLESASGA